MSKLDAASVWAFVAVLVVVLVLLHRRGVSGRAEAMGYTLFAVTLAQGALGYVQLFTGLPIGLVNLHMLGAGVLASTVTFFVGSLRTRDAL